MVLSPLQTLIMVLAVALGTALTRFTPFLLFPEHKNPPKLILYLGETLPAAMMGLLVVYCLRHIQISHNPYGIPELLSVLLIVIVHKWKNNALLSIGSSTLLYMFLLQFVF